MVFLDRGSDWFRSAWARYGMERTDNPLGSPSKLPGSEVIYFLRELYCYDFRTGIALDCR